MIFPFPRWDMLISWGYILLLHFEWFLLKHPGTPGTPPGEISPVVQVRCGPCELGRLRKIQGARGSFYPSWNAPSQRRAPKRNKKKTILFQPCVFSGAKMLLVSGKGNIAMEKHKHWEILQTCLVKNPQVEEFFYSTVAIFTGKKNICPFEGVFESMASYWKWVRCPASREFSMEKPMNFNLEKQEMKPWMLLVGGSFGRVHLYLDLWLVRSGPVSGDTLVFQGVAKDIDSGHILGWRPMQSTLHPDS